MILYNLILLLVFVLISLYHALHTNEIIHIGLSIDDHSYKDMIILMNSIIESTFNPMLLTFHIISCGKDLLAANLLKKSIISSIDNCLSTTKYEVIAFTLPIESGFYLQLQQLKKKSNHWNSIIGNIISYLFIS